jgi:hypothetical protein
MNRLTKAQVARCGNVKGIRDFIKSSHEYDVGVLGQLIAAHRLASCWVQNGTAHAGNVGGCLVFDCNDRKYDKYGKAQLQGWLFVVGYNAGRDVYTWRLFDRTGKVLAGNNESYCDTLNTELCAAYDLAMNKACDGWILV